MTATVAAGRWTRGADYVGQRAGEGCRGQPVEGAELAVVVVDEAVLALSNYELADPITTFYTARVGDQQRLWAVEHRAQPQPAQTMVDEMQSANMYRDSAVGGGRTPAMAAAAAPAADGVMMESAAMRCPRWRRESP